MRLLDPVMKLLREKVLAPRLRTYGEAREELGGMPWRKFQDTARWFLPTHRNLPPPVPAEALATYSGAITIDSTAIALLKPNFADVVERHKIWFFGGVLALLVTTVVLLSSGGSSRAAVVTAPPPAAPAKSAPAAAAPVLVASTPVVVEAPVARAAAPEQRAAQPKVSSSVRALFAAKSSRGAARSVKSKKARRR
jgi:hypothetical protein